MKKVSARNYSWEATKLEDFFGWEVVVVSDIPGRQDYLIVRATHKLSQESRFVAAHVNLVPVGSVERLYKR